VAVHEILGQRVAIKIMNKRKVRLLGMIDKLKREIKILKFFNHPHIIKLFEFIDTQSEIFVVTELAQNGELFDYIQKHDKVQIPS